MRREAGRERASMHNSVTQILALVCRACPVCICARRWPASGFAKAVRRMERHCPACRAYAQVKKGEAHAESPKR